MCEQCQGFEDDDDIDALAHAFVQRHGKGAPTKPAAPQNHALLNHKVAPQPAAASKKVTR